MAGMGFEGAYGAAGTFKGLQDWMTGQRKLVEDKQADTLFQQGQEDRTAGIANEQEIARNKMLAARQAAQQKGELITQIKALKLPPLAEMGAIISVNQDKGLPPQLLDLIKPKTPRTQFAPNGELVNLDDPEIVGQNFAAPKAPAKPRMTIAPNGQVVNLDDPEIAGRNFAAPRPPAGEKSDPVIAVQTTENGQPVVKYLPQSQVVGKTFGKPSTGAGPTLTAPMRKALVDADVAESLLNQLGGLFQGDPKTGKAGAKDLIGPAEGRLRGFGQSTGLSVNTTFAEFKAATARLKNATIQAITGAAMGVDEAKRIIDEIPTENDDPRVWPIKYKQALQNLQNVKHAIHAQAGGTTTGTAEELTGGAGQEFDFVPGKGLVPR